MSVSLNTSYLQATKIINSTKISVLLLINISLSTKHHIFHIYSYKILQTPPTIGLESDRRSRRLSRKPWSSTSCALMSCSFATQTAAVLRTYGSSSFRHLRSGSHRYSVILSTRIQPIVRTANARISGLLSSQSWTKIDKRCGNEQWMNIALHITITINHWW